DSLRGSGGKVTLLDLSPALTADDGAVQAVDDDGVLLYSDDHHLSYRGALKVVGPLRDTIRGLLRPDASTGAGQ
ncbi:MAG: SGNH hydrolase domain-containing protein, partial [Chthoniobacterales bacterium]